MPTSTWPRSSKLLKVKCNWPAIYKRFIDDGFFVWERDHASLMAFLQLLNSADPHLRITWVIHSTQLPYMDLRVCKDLSQPGPLVPLFVQTYQKPHNRYLYIPRASFHRPHVFAGFIKGELIRYAVTNTHAQDFATVAGLLHQRLLDRGYSAEQLQPLFASVTHACRAQFLTSSRRRGRAQQSAPPVFVLPNGLVETAANFGAVINQVYAQHKHAPEVSDVFDGAQHITVAYKGLPSLGSRLVHARL